MSAASQALRKLPPKKRRYVEAIVAGRSKRGAALDAGFTRSMANSAGEKVETADVRAAFAALMREKCPAGKIALRVSQGLDAAEPITNAKGKKVGNRVLYGERRQYAKLAAEFGGLYVQASESTAVVHHLTTAQDRERAKVAIESIRAFDSTCAEPLTGELVDSPTDANTET